MQDSGEHSSISAPERADRLQKFVIVSSARSGTKFLISVLNHHPDIACEMEIFNRSSPHYRKSGLTPSQWHNDPPLALGRFWEKYSHCPEVKAAGFKIMSGQNALAEDFLLKQGDIKKIVLYRKNHIRHYYSCLAANKTGVYASKPIAGLLRDQLYAALRLARNNAYMAAIRRFYHMGQHGKTWLLHGKPYVARPLPMDYQKLQAFIEKKEQFFLRVEKTLRDNNQPFLRVCYEDLAADKDGGCYAKIFDFLGVPYAPAVSSEEKLHPMPLNALIHNYSSLERELRHSPYYPMLSEP